VTLLYVDAFSGVSGDMMLGALVAAGLEEGTLRDVLGRLNLEGYDLAVSRSVRQGLAATRVEVRLHDHGHGHGGHGHGHGRHLPEIEALIARATLPGRSGEQARAVFRRLAEAEAKVHGQPIDTVHFHEVGAVDAIVDIVGTCAGLALLGVDRLVASPLPMGSGYVDTAHGRLPVPAPAVVELMRGLPTRECTETGELTTPTGAALLATLAESFGPMPPMVPEVVGYGAGSREGQHVPNLLRFVLGRAADGGDAAEHDSVWLLETNLDDATGEILGAATTTLMAAGALDVWLTPATMKKGRPGVVLACLATEAARAAVEDAVFRQTGSFGVRRTRVDRTKLAREHVTVETPHGAVRVKIGRRSGEVVVAAPEYEDCLRLAEARGVALRVVYDAARAAYERK